MTRQHSSQVRVYLGNRDVSGDLTTIEPALTLDAEESTTFASAGWHESDGGLIAWEAPFTAFLDSAVGGIGRQLEVPGVEFACLSTVGYDANALGDQAAVYGACKLASAPRSFNVAELVKISGSLKGHGRAGADGVLLHVLGQETVAGNGASVNNAAPSTYGGRFNLHVTAVTGSWTIYVEESSNDGGGDAFATKGTFAQVVAATVSTHSQSIEVTGTIEQYIRLRWAEDAPGSITFVCTGARYVA